MIKHNIEEEAKLMALPEGTSVTVDGVTGILVFSPYPENFEQILKTVYDYIMEHSYADEDDSEERILEEGIYDACEKYRRSYNGEGEIKENLPSEEYFHLFHRFYDAYEFGIQYLQPEDYNVSPRDIGKPYLKKGQTVVCYKYPAEEYKIIQKS
jgi:hypothetical protein